MSLNKIAWIVLALAVAGLALSGRMARTANPLASSDDSRSEVVFWHFWGGSDRDVVDDVVERFNRSQDQFRVRAIAMPGNNLQAKLFLSIAGGDPPDLVNQDDPVVGDWAARNIVMPLDSFATPAEVTRIRQHLFPAARKLGTWNERLFAVCNGLDVRALYYNRTALEADGLSPPQSIADLNRIARTVCPPAGTDQTVRTFGYLPDSRRLWAWGYVFGGSFYDRTTGQFSLTGPAIVEAARWMQQYAAWYGPDTINRFRTGDQSLPGKAFPLLPVTDDEMRGRYVVLMDGQWRTRDIRAFLERRGRQSIPAPQFGVCPLPPPPGGRTDAGWVNGNIFVVPRGAKNTAGALAFMKFWIGLDDPAGAARTCTAGGWIPVSETVVDHPQFQEYLDREPLFREFVRLAASPHQFPVPVVRGGSVLKRTVEQAAAEIMTHPEVDPRSILKLAETRLIRSGPGDAKSE